MVQDVQVSDNHTVKYLMPLQLKLYDWFIRVFEHSIRVY